MFGTNKMIFPVINGLHKLLLLLPLKYLRFITEIVAQELFKMVTASESSDFSSF